MGYVMETVCPVCHRNDQVQKVSGVVSAGSATYSSTALSNRLQMWSAPSPDTTVGCIAGWLLVISILCFAGIPVNLLSVFLGRPFSSGDAIAGLIAEVVISIPAITIAMALFSAQRKRNTIAAAQYQQWASARAKWDTLYYCFRDDVVFLPDGAGSAPSSNWASLLL